MGNSSVSLNFGRKWIKNQAYAVPCTGPDTQLDTHSEAEIEYRVYSKKIAIFFPPK